MPSSSRSLRFGVLPASRPRDWHERCLQQLLQVEGLQQVPHDGSELDFLLDFAGAETSRSLSETARYGVWSFFAGRPPRPLTEPAGYWEVYRDEETTHAGLWQLTADSTRGRQLFGAILHTCTTQADNAEQLLEHAVRWPALVARRLMLGDVTPFERPLEPLEPHRAAAPGPLHRLTMPLRTVRNRTRKLWHRCYLPQWNVGLTDVRLDQLVEGVKKLEIRWVDEPPRRFFADPFILGSEGARVRMLVEDFDFATSLGKISELTVDRDGRVLACETAIEREHHLSYPFVIEREGKTCCIPEMGIEARVELFEKNGAGWQHARTLVDGYPALDPTPLHRDGRWWLFCTSWSLGEDNNLCILHADSLEGPWTEHPLNPVKTDVTSCRPAGPFFEVGGQLYRPAQIGTGNYGGGISIQRVETLSTTRYEEVEVARIEPDPGDDYPAGLHTLVEKDGVVVVDGKRWAFGPFVKLLARLRTGR